MNLDAARLRSAMTALVPGHREGDVVACNGLVVEAIGPDARLGEVCELRGPHREGVLLLQVIGFRDGHVLLMPFGATTGIAVGDRIRATGKELRVPVGDALLGRVVDAFGVPIDGLGEIATDTSWPVHRAPIDPLSRRDDDIVLETGVRVVDTLLTMGKGQRVGVFAGSGVGKSTLLGMLARHVQAEVIVIGLIGERGREVGDFIHQVLGEHGMRRAVVVAATSDQPALVRAHATHVAHAVAEYFRDQGKDVLLMVDSVTRFAMAQREIGLAAGEPPTSRGYPPSVFNALPKLTERGGAIQGRGSVSSVYSVLVEGDDMNEPVADHMRALLDGHVVLTREQANRGQWPAVDPLRSVSRWINRLTTREERAIATEVQRLFAAYEQSRDLVDMGAWQKGSNPLLDRAVRHVPSLEAFFRQAPDESLRRDDGYAALVQLLAADEAIA